MDVAGIEVLRTLEERVAPQHTAVLIVDMQNDYCAAGGASDRNGRDVSAAQAMAPAIRALAAAARGAGIPLVFTKYTVGPGTAGLSGPEILRRGLNFAGVEATVRGTWGHELWAEMPFDPKLDVVIEKRRLSAFTGTELDLLLKARGIKTVVVAGTVTQGCVESTVRDAANHDFYVAVPRDCMASTNVEVHERSLLSMATVLRYEEAITDSGRLVAIWG
jgi:ureidoacrylate peracid hydrolase